MLWSNQPDVLCPHFDSVGSAVLTGARGENILYFGCRHRHKDFLYKEELGWLVVSGC